jgi:predicted peroxiredoxin
MATDKLVFMVLHGPTEPEHATIPFVMACAALASDVEVVIGLQANGVELGRIGGADSVEADGFPPLKRNRRL